MFKGTERQPDLFLAQNPLRTRWILPPLWKKNFSGRPCVYEPRSFLCMRQLIFLHDTSPYQRASIFALIRRNLMREI